MVQEDCDSTAVHVDRSAQAMKLQKAHTERMRRESWLLKAIAAKLQVDRFLVKHGFRVNDDVNKPKKTAFGLRCTYPLHTAARSQDWHMVCLLLYFGANPLQRDSRGRTMFTYMEGHCVPEEVRRFIGQPQSALPDFIKL
ncbi:KTR3 [Symbiodinium natans]|uniref:KTR3 protein n=1 Tax=Symbiodinium natans TaxID=878477 RepID=A0A812U0T6_9DINO|nr:KTR3 [Symbiodinium natans]